MSGETLSLLEHDSLGMKEIGDKVVSLENNSSGMADNKGLFGSDLSCFGYVSCPSGDNLEILVEIASLS